MTTIFQHPDGHEIYFADNTLTVVTSDGDAVSIPMGRAALHQLAGTLDAGDNAEQDGAGLAINCLNAIKNAPSQAVSVTALKTALLDLQRLPHPDRAAGGFAVALVATLEHGMGVQQ